MNDLSENVEGVSDDLQPVVKKWGREMFAFVFNAGVAGEALGVLGMVVEHHQSRHGMQAVRMLGKVWNETAMEMARRKEWTAGMLAECERDILLHAGKRIIVPGRGN